MIKAWRWRDCCDRQVIINPPQDLVPGAIYNASVLACGETCRADRVSEWQTSEAIRAAHVLLWTLLVLDPKLSHPFKQFKTYIFKSVIAAHPAVHTLFEVSIQSSAIANLASHCWGTGSCLRGFGGVWWLQSSCQKQVEVLRLAFIVGDLGGTAVNLYVW